MLRRSRQRLICATRDNIREFASRFGKKYLSSNIRKTESLLSMNEFNNHWGGEREYCRNFKNKITIYVFTNFTMIETKKKKSILQFFVSQRFEKLDDESGTFIRRIFSVGIVERKKEREATNARATTNSNNQTEQTVRLNRANRSPLVDQRIYASINTWPVTRVRRSQYIEIDPN